MQQLSCKLKVRQKNAAENTREMKRMRTNYYLEKLYQDMQLRGYAEHTQEVYGMAVRKFLNYSGKSAEGLDEHDVRDYALHLMEGNLSKGSVNTDQAAIRFFFGVTLNRNMNYLQMPRLKKDRTLPEILSREEITRLLERCENPKHRAMFTLAYGSGLRVSEIRALRAEDIDSKQMRIFIRGGKGNKDRYSILSRQCLLFLREYWRSFRPNHPKGLLFPGWRNLSGITSEAINEALKKWLAAAGISRKVSIHSLRHAFATHLLEDGVDIFTIKELLGHRSISSTTIYLHLANIGGNLISPADRIGNNGR